MNDFAFYFDLGWRHIISIDALDHILFVIVLAALYLLKNWKQVLILVTAFTIGHSLTLALSVYDLVRINGKWVEFLIPCTIMATAIFNIRQKSLQPGSLKLNYFLALIFGLIHGLGFANTIRFMLAKNEKIALPLFSFNVGLEAGQIIIVTGILLLSYLFVQVILIKRKWWIWALSSVAFCIALKMAWERWPFE
ncbi:MAG: HupE/UreJ family protein [Chitinophagaceae bacterium]|nr:HupE/UreJ family protein [Chitinophagaceae bacterium]